jgi:hypothetical protein
VWPKIRGLYTDATAGWNEVQGALSLLWNDMQCIEEEAESLGTRMAPWSRVSGWTDSIDQAMKELQAAWQLAKGIPVAYCRIKPSTLGDEMTDSTALCSGPGSPHRGVECIRRKSPRYGDVFEYIGSAFCCLSCKETEKTSEVLAKCTWSKRWR